ncbi:MAG TPA: fused MFS/spermidine synthase [Roseiflexaceae bacterium]|nr:fused MFS/spermidine synthase [Roseiflexaceae bacterium]
MHHTSTSSAATEAEWQRAHLRLLAERLAPLAALPDGLVHRDTSGPHDIRILKVAGQLHYYFRNASNGDLEGPMSRMALDRPLHLLAQYTQAALLTLAWRPDPAQICLLGLAGGRLSLVLYHAFPRAAIVNVDIDPAAAPIAERFFGVTFDARQRSVVADARDYLERGDPGTRFDIIVMDAFRDERDRLDRLSTGGFYTRCRERLAPGGALAVNLLKSDPLFWAKIKTFQHHFRHTLICRCKHGVVLLGNDRLRLGAPEIARRLDALQRRFSFPLVEHAAELVLPRALPNYDEQVWRAAPLLDDAP